MEKEDSIAQIEELMAKCGVSWETLAQKTRQPQWIIDTVKNGKVANSTTINAIMRMRHVLVHDYYQIKPQEMWKVISEDLKPLR